MFWGFFVLFIKLPQRINLASYKLFHWIACSQPTFSRPIVSPIPSSCNLPQVLIQSGWPDRAAILVFVL
jgi:hypothetical protein